VEDDFAVLLIRSRVRSRFSAADRTLLLAGTYSLVVATIGVVAGRSGVLCGAFAIVGLTLFGVSTLAPSSAERGAPDVAATTARRRVAVTNDPLPTDRVETRVRYRYNRRYGRGADTSRAHATLTSAIYLLLLILFSTALISAIALAVVIGTVMILAGH
jgi:hypothetical protein